MNIIHIIRSKKNVSLDRSESPVGTHKLTERGGRQNWIVSMFVQWDRNAFRPVLHARKLFVFIRFRKVTQRHANELPLSGPHRYFLYSQMLGLTSASSAER